MRAPSDIPLRQTQLTAQQQALLENRLRGEGRGGANRIPRRPAALQDEVQVSFAQQRLWFLDQLSPGSNQYNTATAIRVNAWPNVSVLQRTVDEIVRRHESLRTTFKTIEGEPMQVIAPRLATPVMVRDLCKLPLPQRESETSRILAEEVQRPFELSIGPLLRVVVIRLRENEAILLLTMHHVISDGWSLGILSRELSVLYGAYAAGAASPLPELPLQYADFACWQRQWLSGAELQRQLEYWRRNLAGLPTLSLPTDRPRPAVQSFRGSSLPLELSPQLSRQVRELGHQHQATLFMVMLAGFVALLSRSSDQEDVAVGTPIANRTRPELEGLIGFFVNTLVLRVDLSGDPTFSELVQRTRECALGAYAHQDLPFERLVEELHPQRDLGRNPLFQVNFQLYSSPEGSSNTPGGGGGSTAPLIAGGGRVAAIFDLAFNLWEADGKICGPVEYSSDLFDRSTVSRLVHHYGTLLQAAVEAPSTRISQLPLLDATEKHQLLVEWNRTDAEYPKHKLIHQLIEEQVARTPEAVAVECEKVRLSYREISRLSDVLSTRLRRMGIGRGSRVGLCMRRCGGLLVGVLGILKAGAAYVPLDPDYPAERLAYMLDDAGIGVLVGQLPPELGDRCDGVRSIRIDPSGRLQDELDAPDAALLKEGASDARPEDPAYVIYTSGSSGRPKGVLVHHQGLVNYLWWCSRAYKTADGEGAPVHSSISFDLTITGLFAPLLVGRKVVLLADSGGAVQDPEALATALRWGQNYSLVKITPVHLNVLSRTIPPSEAAGRTRAFIIGGENLLASDVAFWLRWAPQTALVNEYGPTETVVGCCTYTVPPDYHGSGSIPIGRPIANTQLYVLDRHLQPVPIGVVGELFIGGDGVALGYLGRPELSAERFIANPFGRPGTRLYRTGDLVRYLADGNLEFIGRCDEQLKIRGYRVEPGEIEAAITEREEVRAAAVIVWKADPKAAPEDRRLVAYVVPSDAAKEEAARDAAGWIARLRRHLQTRLPDFMVPAYVVLVGSLPVTQNGKLNRGALPPPNSAVQEPRASYTAPADVVEQVLAAIWADVLKVPSVGRNDHFFNDLGGHSLLVTQLMSRVREAFRMDVSLRRLFEAPTIAAFAQTLRDDPQQWSEVRRAAELIISLAAMTDEEVDQLASETAGMPPDARTQPEASR